MSSSKMQRIREAAEADLETFIKLVHPGRVLGHCHQDVIHWWGRDDAKKHQLLLLPRDHQKSALLAYRVAWRITKDPTVRILYISSTQNLAVKQLKFIKDILTSDIYRRYWPEMVNEKESTREKWTEWEISVDHPRRKAEFIRDPTVFTAGLTSNIVGMHCDVICLDDVVVGDNAYSPEGREKVRTQVGYLASIAGTDSEQWAVGTRYHPVDLYHDLQNQKLEIFNADGDLIEEEHLFETYSKVVEDRGDGTGTYLWPRQMRIDGKWFGFDQRVLATKKAQYPDKTKFRAQYYNDPNDAETAPITYDMFQYYDRKALIQRNGITSFDGRRLNVFAAIDFAFSLSTEADFTALAVVGVDSLHNHYILDLARFKTDRIGDYFAVILKMYQRWGFRKLRAEISVAQKIIVKDLKENYIRPNGLAISIDEHRPLTKDGAKEERILASLQPKYQNNQMWHFRGGNCEILETELVSQNPAHDDLKDALACCIDICQAPTTTRQSLNPREMVRGKDTSMFNSRFGGISV